jgi:AcrR family transcriptional regulator
MKVRQNQTGSPEKRSYTSELRQQAKDETRGRILQAAIDVILKDGVHAFTVKNVADRAGVALRTVYRHFATRDALLEGLDEHGSQVGALGVGVSPPTNLTEAQALVRPLFAYFGAERDLFRATVIASLATGYTPRGFLERRVQTGKLLAAEYPHLPEAEIEEARALIGIIAGSRGWYLLTVEHGLDSERAGAVAEASVRTLCQDLKKRNAAATRKP